MGVVHRGACAMPALYQEQIERELAEFLLRSGGRLNDRIEFDVMQYLLDRNRNLTVGEPKAETLNNALC
jgi:hypothetical protein